ncbi:MAG TPA: ABC transporter permease [Bryobacteraceae bacterium]|nr:ABC transporter permease [Bryobacteraceae bacterium]
MHDLRCALRTLRRNRAFALAALLTIALGVGANTAVFSVVRGVLLQPLPFREPERLVMLWQTHPAIPQLQLTTPDFDVWRARNHSFDQMAAYTLQAMNKISLIGYGEPEQIQGTMMSANLLPMMGVTPIVGRGISPSEERGREHVALMSEALWRRKFGADRSIVGKPIRIDTESFTLVGIVPQRNGFPVWADIWLPLSLLEPELQTNRQFHPLEVVAHLRPGVSIESAEADMQALAHRLAEAHPATNKTVGAAVVPLADEVSGRVRPALLVVWAAVGLILLIACVNVAHLMLAHGASRRREAAIRAAVGAQRSQLIRLFLVESVSIAVLGGALGLMLALYLTPALTSLAAAEIPRFAQVSVDGGVFMFALAVSTLCGVLFGLPLAIRSARTDLGEALKQSGGVSFALRRGRIGGVLVMAEVALSLAVLIGAGLLVRSFAALLNIAPGFRADHVLAMQVHLPSSKYDWQKAEQFFRTTLFPKLRTLPGVTDVAAANTVPMALDRTEHSRFATRFGIVGQTFEPGHFPVALNRWVSAEYVQAMGIPLKSGRYLNESDSNKPVVLINEAIARRFFAGQDPVGKQILLSVMTPKPSAVEIVGVVGDTRDWALDIEPEATFYGVAISPSMTLVARTKGDANSLASTIRQTAMSTNPELVVGEVRSMDEVVGRSLAQRRFALLLVSGFALLALVLATIGISGVVSYSIATRTRELGLRMALGAQYREVVGLLLKESLALVAPGLVAGCVLAFALTRIMESLLYGVTAADPLTYLGAALFLLTVAMTAVYLPARRAMRIDPMLALREQ